MAKRAIGFVIASFLTAANAGARRPGHRAKLRPRMTHKRST